MDTNDAKDSVPEEQFDTQSVENTNVATTEKSALDDENVEQQTVDFSDEEANLSSSAPEFDLGEEEHEEHEEENANTKNVITEFAGKSKDEIIAALEVIISSRPIHTIRREVETAKIAFYKVYRSEVEAAKKAFLDAGGLIEEFVIEKDENEEKLKALFSEYRHKRDEYISKSENDKENNYKIKLQIIDELKNLLNSNETLNHTFSEFRDLQTKWKEAGQVPQAYVKDIWETYHLHVENFYNFIKINNELRDLDIKKNVEAKLKLCEDAEALLLDTSAVSAFHKLQKLHEQWREVGPVSNEYKEQLWERFRDVSSKINKRHQDYFESIKDEQQKNLDLKTELCVKTEELLNTPLATRKEWVKASDELIEIQKVWKTIGFAPKKDNTKIYERFRTACDNFFEKKREFYQSLKSEMDVNLQAKIDICVLAEALQDSTEWKKASDELIALQKKWKGLGAVSRRHSDNVWKRFRKACDTFFENKSKHFSEVDSKYEDNLIAKKALLEEIKVFEIGERESSFEALKEFQRRWTEIGFVPMKEKEKIQAEYRKVIDEHFSKLKGNDRDRKVERFKDKITNLKENKGNKVIRNERERLYNKVKQLEADIALLENNIGFFAKSKNAESMIRDVKDKIAKAKEEMAITVEKIIMIDNQSAE